MSSQKGTIERKIRRKYGFINDILARLLLNSDYVVPQVLRYTQVPEIFVQRIPP